MTGTILQVSVSRGGIPKRAIAEGILETRGFEGDSWAHPRFHGGRDQAVLLIADEAIQELACRGFSLYPGALGENLTTSGLDPRTWRAGQQYRVGLATIQLTRVRQPCSTLDMFGTDRNGIPIQAAIYSAAVKRGDFSSPEWALGGFYASVLRAGVIRPGDSIVLETDVA